MVGFDMDPHEFSHVYLVISSVLVMNRGMLLDTPKGEGSTTSPEPQPTPSTTQPVFHEPQTEAHIEQILPYPSTYQRKRKTQKCRRTKKDTKLHQASVSQDLVAYEAVHKEGGDSVERVITTTASLDAAQDRNGYRCQSQAPRHHGGAPAQTRSERVLVQPNEPPLSEGHTSGNKEGRMEHQFELTANVLDLEKEKDAQAVEILKLKKRVKRLERQRKSSTSQPRRRKYRQVESSDDDLNEEDASKQGMSSMLTRSMAAKLTTALVSKCLFVDFLSEIEPKEVFEALKHLGWVDKMQEELNQLYRNKVWTLVLLPYGKIAIGKGIDYDETFALVPPGFEISEFHDYVCKLDKALYGLKQAPKTCSSIKTPMVPLNNLGSDLASKPVNETLYRGMIGSLMYLTITRPDI
ncbi:retrovirus-related pol polyprotein from transposon TNT 1-94 [Tanacetum coccineum]